MKLKKEYLILFVVILALALYLGLRDRGGSHADLPQPQALEAQRIDRIAVTGQDYSWELVKKDEHWTVQPKDYPADPAQVTNMLSSIAKLELTALASTSGSYTPYELDDDEKITVKAFSGTDAVREFYIGKVAPTFRHTYVLLAGDKNVYHAQGAFRNIFYTTVDELRDKHVMTFDRDAIASIEILKGDQRLTATKTEAPAAEQPPAEEKTGQTAAPAAPRTQWTTAQGDVLDQDALDGLLNSLSGLQCEGFINESTKADLGTPQWSVTFKDASGAYTLSVFAKAKEDDLNQPATASTNPYVFSLQGSQVKTFEDQIDALLKNEKKA